MANRYDFEINEDTGELEILIRQNGDYVDASEYDALFEEVERLNKIIATAIDNLRDA